MSHKTATFGDKEIFTVPEGYDMEGTAFQISDIEVEDHPDGSGAGVLTYDLTHDDDVDGNELAKVVNNVILDALKRQIEEPKNDTDQT